MSTIRERMRLQSFSESFVYDEVEPLYQTSHYEVRIVFDSTHKLDDYGVVNKETGIIEHFTNNIGRAKWLANESTELAVNGYRDPTDDLLAKLTDAMGEPDEDTLARISKKTN